MAAAVAEQSVFRGTLDFFQQIGVYDVILPFLLVFTIVFAILEKTRVFGYDKLDGREYSKKNLNGMMAFVTAFFVVASTQLVAAINKFLSSIVLLLLLSICFLLVAGSFHTGKEEFFLKKGWEKLFMVLSFVAVILVFLGSLPYDENNTWLDFLWYHLTQNFNSVIVSSLILVIIVVGFIFYVTKEP